MANDNAPLTPPALVQDCGPRVDTTPFPPVAPAAPESAKEWQVEELAQYFKHYRGVPGGSRTSESEHFVLTKFEGLIHATLYTLWALQDESTRNYIMRRESKQLTLAEIADLLTAYAHAQSAEAQSIVDWVRAKCEKYPEVADPLNRDLKEYPPKQWIQCAMHQVFHKAGASKTYQRIAIEQQQRAEAAEAKLAEQAREIERLKGELRTVDASLGNRLALDVATTRADKIELACREAGKVGPQQVTIERLTRERDELRDGNDSLRTRSAELAAGCLEYQRFTGKLAETLHCSETYEDIVSAASAERWMRLRMEKLTEKLDQQKSAAESRLAQLTAALQQK